MDDQLKYVKRKLKEYQDLARTDFMGLKNIPDDAKEKILASYKRMNFKPYKQQKDALLKDVEKY